MNGITPEDVKTFLEAFKVLNAAHPILGFIVASIGLLTGVITLINNHRTKKNTAANEATAAMLTEAKTVIAAHEKRMAETEDRLTKLSQKTVSEFRESTSGLMTEMNNMKIVMAKVHFASDSKLSMIPRLQDAIAELDKRTLDTAFKAAQTGAKVEEIMNVITKAKGGRNG